MDEIAAVFVTESREQLVALESTLLQLENAPDDDDALNAIFRAAHTIKGGAGVVECDFIVAFTHVVENVLDKLRAGEIRADGDLIALLLACADHIGHLLDVLESGGAAPDAAHQAEGDALLAKLQHNWLAAPTLGTIPHAPPAGCAPLAEAEATVHSSGGGIVDTDCWHISLRFGENVLRQGMDPLTFLRYLTTLGSIVRLETLADALPAAEGMDAESCYLGFEISFASQADKAAIERVFDFVRDDCVLHILPPRSRLTDYIKLILELPEDTMRLGEILVRIGALTQAELEEGLAAQQAAQGEPAAPSAAAPLGQILVDHQMVQPELVEAAVVRQKQVSDKKHAEARLIRIPADKLDRLIDLVGELVIAGAGVNLLASQTERAELNEATSLMNRLVEDIRGAALQLRMVQIGETFSRFNRVVRDVSRELGKDIELVIRGGDTELDKSVVEKIGDPLMHLVRNAMDHGIEPASQRAAVGKPPRGRLELNAWHDSGSIVIEVADDGGGLDRDRIVRKAIERGLVAPDQALSEQEIYDLLFAPGFSTAEQVSNLSGRGVGMDVVKRNIQSLRGRIEIASVPGQGTRFSIRLPLTMAIIDGFLVSAGAGHYVVPLDMMVECLELQAGPDHRNYLNLRGEVLPFIRLRDLFGLPGTAPLRENVVVVRAAGRKAGIVVDHLVGEFQTVIKPLGHLFRNLRGIGGSTILGSGEVALILDVQALTQLAAHHEKNVFQAHRPPSLPTTESMDQA